MKAFISIAIIQSRTGDKIIAYCPIYNEASNVSFIFSNWDDLTFEEKRELKYSDWNKEKRYRAHKPFTENFQLSIIDKEIEL